MLLNYLKHKITQQRLTCQIKNIQIKKATETQNRQYTKET